jgi:hypothetical protein
MRREAVETYVEQLRAIVPGRIVARLVIANVDFQLPRLECALGDHVRELRMGAMAGRRGRGDVDIGGLAAR